MTNALASLQAARKSPTVWLLGLAIALTVWFVVYQQLLPMAQWLVAQTPITPDSHLAASVEFFFFDTPQVLMLLTLVVFVMGGGGPSFHPNGRARCWPENARASAILPPPTSAY